MELNRTTFQGVKNIIRFNWHFYALAALGLLLVFLFKHLLPESIGTIVYWMAILAAIAMSVSLLVSHYVYDVSALYQLNWLTNLNDKKVITIHAGLDEISEIIKVQYPQSEVVIADFYNADKHTEVSIKRARKAYPTNSDTIKVTTGELPFSDQSFEYLICFLSAHEIRNEQERIAFFRELNRITKSKGQIYLTEHVRDRNNFMAYSLGSFHFLSRPSWLLTITQAKLNIIKEIKTTPFITTFILEKNGDTF